MCRFEDAKKLYLSFLDFFQEVRKSLARRLMQHLFKIVLNQALLVLSVLCFRYLLKERIGPFHQEIAYRLLPNNSITLSIWKRHCSLKCVLLFTGN